MSQNAAQQNTSPQSSPPAPHHSSTASSSSQEHNSANDPGKSEQSQSESTEKEKKQSSVVKDVLQFASSFGRLFSGNGPPGRPSQPSPSLNDNNSDSEGAQIPLNSQTNSDYRAVRSSDDQKTSKLDSKDDLEKILESMAINKTDTTAESTARSNQLHPPLLNFANKSAAFTSFPATPKSISAPSFSCMDLAMASTPLTPAVIPGIALAASDTFSVMEREDSATDCDDSAKRRTKSSPSMTPRASGAKNSLTKRSSEKPTSSKTPDELRKRRKPKASRKNEKPVCLKSPRAVLRAIVPSAASQSRRMDLLLLHESPQWEDLTAAAWNGCSHANRAHIWRLLVHYEPLKFSDREPVLRAKRLEYRHFIRALYAPMGRVRFDSSSPACTAEVENLDVYNVDTENNFQSDLDIITKQGDIEQEDDDGPVDSINKSQLPTTAILYKSASYERFVTANVSQRARKGGRQIEDDCGESNELTERDDVHLDDSKEHPVSNNEEPEGNLREEDESERTQDSALKRNVIEYSSFSAKTLRQIEMDLPRTHPNIPVFHIPQVRNSMRRILYIYGMLNPNNNYVQGMNEILSAVIIVFLVECEISKERRQQYSPWMSKSPSSQKRSPHAHAKDEPTETLSSSRSSSIPSSRFSGGSSSPASSSSSTSSLFLSMSPKSPNSTSIETFLQRTDLGEILTGQELVDAEADAYWTFSSIIALIDDNFVPDQPGIMRRVARLEEIVSKVDPVLSTHLEQNGNDFLQFAFRWMNCLLMRELPFGLVIKLWDCLLAHPNGISDFHIYFCAALITRFTDHLIELDFEQCMLFLQHLPTSCWTGDDIDELLSQAHLWEQSLGLDCTASQ